MEDATPFVIATPDNGHIEISTKGRTSESLLNSTLLTTVMTIALIACISISRDEYMVAPAIVFGVCALCGLYYVIINLPKVERITFTCDSILITGLWERVSMGAILHRDRRLRIKIDSVLEFYIDKGNQNTLGKQSLLLYSIFTKHPFVYMKVADKDERREISSWLPDKLTLKRFPAIYGHDFLIAPQLGDKDKYMLCDKLNEILIDIRGNRGQ